MKSLKKLSLIKPLDIIFIVATLALSFYFIFAASKGNALKRLLLINGEEIVTLSWKDQALNLYEMTGKQMFVEVNDGKARVLRSSCPDKLCVKMGWISECGHIAACLPNNVALMVDCSDNFNITEDKNDQTP